MIKIKLWLIRITSFIIMLVFTYKIFSLLRAYFGGTGILLPLFVLIFDLFLPVTAGVFAARIISQWYIKSAFLTETNITSAIPQYKKKIAKNLWLKCIIWFFVISYIITWIFGVPAVQSSINTWVVEKYKQLKAQGDSHIREVHPIMRAYWAFPIMPGVIIIYHKYLITSIGG